MDIAKWSIEDIVDSCSKNPKGDKKLLIPKVQRHREWKKIQENDLIDTLKINKISIGALQLYHVDSEDKTKVYLLADGLHRVTTIVKYYNNPFIFDRTKKTIDTIMKKIINEQSKYDKEKIKEICVEWFNYNILGNYNNIVNNEFENMEDELEEIVAKNIDKDHESMCELLMNETKKFAKYINISKSFIPVIINVDIETMPLLFKRINQNGTPLKCSDVLAATWYDCERFDINNNEIVQCIEQHYDEIKKENNGMEIFDDNGDENFSIYEYIIGLFGVIKKENDESFISFIKDREFIFKLIACCFYGDMTKKNIMRINDNFEDIDLQNFEDTLLWAISFVSELIDDIAIFNGKLVIREIPFYIIMISTIFRNIEKIKKNKKHYKYVFMTHILYDKLSNVSLNSKYIRTNILNSLFMNRIKYDDLNIKLNRYTNDSIKIIKQKDRISPSSMLILSLLRNILNIDDELLIGNIIDKKALIKFGKDHNTYLPVNTLGNICYYPKLDKKKKTSETLFAFLVGNNGLNESEFCNDYLFINDNNEYDDLIKRTEIKIKYYQEFCKFRMTNMSEIILNYYKEYLKEPDSENDELSESEDSSYSDAEQTKLSIKNSNNIIKKKL